MTETKIPPGSPVRIGFNVTLTLSPGLSVLAFQPERTRYGGGFISTDQTTGVILKTLVDNYGVLPPEVVQTVTPTTP